LKLLYLWAGGILNVLLWRLTHFPDSAPLRWPAWSPDRERDLSVVKVQLARNAIRSPFSAALCFRLALGVVVILGLPSGWTLSGQPKPLPGDLDVKVTLFRSGDGMEQPVRPEDISIASVKPGAQFSSLESLLLSLKIFPNSDAAGLIESLNPGEDLGAVTPSETIRVLSVAPDEKAAAALSAGFRYRIYYDELLIHQLLDEREPVRKRVAAFSSWPVERFAESRLREPTAACISNGQFFFDQILDHLEDRIQPLNHQMLLQLRDDVALFSRILDQTGPSGRILDSRDSATLCEITGDLSIKNKGFEAARSLGSGFPSWPQVSIMATTVDAATGTPVQLWTIHWAAEQLQDDPEQDHQLNVITSSVQILLPEADYVFWATKGAAVSNRKRVSVRTTADSKPLPIQIPVSVKP
jgi:hypothetical protein